MALNFSFHYPGLFTQFNPIALIGTVETPYIRTKVYPVFYKQVVVEYSIPPEWGDCTFNIYRAETNTGPWAQVNPAPLRGTFFKDVDLKDFSKFMRGYYIVECTLPDSRSIQGPPTSWEEKRHSWVEIRANEIQRREMLLLTKFTGVKSIVFRKKHFGKRCGNCWNFITEKVTKDHCKVCLGTSFEGGYFEGFETLLQYNPTTDQTTLDYKGKAESNVITAWTISAPKMDTFDLILRVSDMALFRIEQSQQTELQTQAVRQILTLNELSKDSIEFNLISQILPGAYLI